MIHEQCGQSVAPMRDFMFCGSCDKPIHGYAQHAFTGEWRAFT